MFVLPALTAGGAERVVINLMNNLDGASYEKTLLVITSKDNELETLVSQNVNVVKLEKKYLYLSLRAIYKNIKKVKPDLILSTMTPTNYCILLLQPFFLNIKFIVREAITPSYNFKKYPFLKWLLQRAYTILYKRADLVISPAQTIIDEFEKLPNMNIKNHTVLFNPVNVKHINKDETKTFDNTGDAIVRFIASGRLHHQKGFDRLIKAMAQFNSEYNWHLTILGKGAEYQNLKALINKYGLGKNISLKGFREHPWHEYAQADCFLLPSRWEGLPNVALESLSVGTPVISINQAGGILEIQKETNNNSIIITENMDDFLEAMSFIKPGNKKTYADSLLPKTFEMKAIMARFQTLIEQLY